MNKKEVTAVLNEIALLLELSGENPFKARSYTNVARQVEHLEEDIGALAAEKRLREIKGVGDALEQKLEELVTTGALKYHRDLRAKFPESLFELFGIPGLGAKRIKVLYEDLGIQSLGELEYACIENRLIGQKGFGAKMQQKVLDGVAFAKRHQGLHLVDTAWREADRLRDWLASEPSVTRIEVAGSIRRCKEVVKDIDLLVASDSPEVVMGRFVEAGAVETVTGRGETKSSVVLTAGIAADLRVVTEEQFPFALAHFTGSKEHNIVMRRRAKEREMKLNEYGLFRGDACVPCADEAAIFEELGLSFIPPELREDMGEFDGPPPSLVEQGGLVGVFHCHSNASDGSCAVDEMAEGARARGYRYIVIADHSQSAAYAGGLSVEGVRRQHREIDAFNTKMKGFCVLKGIESDIRTDGALDYDDDLLGTFDLVIASIHSKLGMDEAEATRRIIKAVENPHTAILGHPTGRLLLSRAGYPLDMAAVMDACLGNGVAIEINANPRRLELDWRHVRRAGEKGVKLVIGPDAHSVAGLDDVRYGVGIARKGGLGPGDLLNCMTAEEVLAWRERG